MRSGTARFAFVTFAGLILGSTFAGAQSANLRQVQNFGMRRPPVQQALGARGDEGRWWNNQRIIDQLKLSDDQRKAMDQIMFDYRSKLIDVRANLSKAELSMQELMSADQPDQKAMETQIDKVIAARGEVERANDRFLLAIRMKLTPDQWKQLRQTRMAGMGAGPQGPGPQGPGPNGPMQQWNRRGRALPPPPGPPTPPANTPPATPGQGPGAGMEQ